MRSLATRFWNINGDQTTLCDNASVQQNAPLFKSIYASSLPVSDKRVERIAQEGFVIVTAGGETTSRVLSMAMFFIVSNPHVLKQLLKEIMTVMPNANEIPPAKTLEGLHYLGSDIASRHFSLELKLT